MKEFSKVSGLEIANLIRKREVSPVEVLESHIHRIQQVNPLLNAMVENDFDRARHLAHQQEKELLQKTDSLPIFFGVPFTVKEMFSYQGMKRTGGSIHHRDEVMSWDASVVERMKKAGGIPLGTTNVPELGFWFETHNPIYGRTKNPFDLSRTCGGSSGGEGALIGAGASPLGLGSDIGGSIRMPATFCGVFGHKPTRKLLPLTGHFPFSREDFKTILVGEKYPYTSMGPLTRKAEDLYPMLKVLMGADGFDQETLVNPQLEELTTEWAGRKVLVCPSPVFEYARKTDGELADVVLRCAKHFQDLGAEVEELNPFFFRGATALWFSALKSSKIKNLHENLMEDATPAKLVKEIFKIGIGKADYTLPNLVVALGELLGPHKSDFTEDLRLLAKMAEDLDSRLGEDGILLLPPHPRVAPKHLAPVWSPFDFIYTAIFTVLGHPATSVPMGLNAEGVPLGVQVVARRMKDHLTLSCAELLEERFGGWSPPQILA